MTIPRLVVLVVAVAALVAAAPALRNSSQSLRDQVSSFIESHGAGGKGQSAEQISSGEFNAVTGGMSTKELRNLVGAPADANSVEVEGLKLDCLYYGVAGATGAYQFCFLDGKLSSKRRFESVP